MRTSTLDVWRYTWGEGASDGRRARATCEVVTADGPVSRWKKVAVPLFRSFFVHVNRKLIQKRGTKRAPDDYGVARRENKISARERGTEISNILAGHLNRSVVPRNVPSRDLFPKVSWQLEGARSRARRDRFRAFASTETAHRHGRQG